jgi:hypothetical protein
MLVEQWLSRLGAAAPEGASAWLIPLDPKR